jgi:hypothetical protein
VVFPAGDLVFARLLPPCSALLLLLLLLLKQECSLRLWERRGAKRPPTQCTGAAAALPLLWLRLSPPPFPLPAASVGVSLPYLTIYGRPWTVILCLPPLLILCHLAHPLRRVAASKRQQPIAAPFHFLRGGGGGGADAATTAGHHTWLRLRPPPTAK